MSINYAELRTYPIENILRSRGIEFRQQGNELVIKSCPLPTHVSREPYTFKVGVRENLWKCYSKSCRRGRKAGGDVLDLICELDSVSVKEAAMRLECKENRNSYTVRPPTIQSLTSNNPLGYALQNVNPVHPMIQSRGILVATAVRWNVGYYKSKQGTASMDDRIVFPIYEDGFLVSYAGRTVLPVTDDNPKWKLGKNFKKTTLYGIERCDPAAPLIVCESPWEVLLGHQMGKQTAALIGTAMTAEQEKRLEPYGTIWVMMDNDDAGREASAIVCARLEKKHRVIRSFLKD